MKLYVSSLPVWGNPPAQNLGSLTVFPWLPAVRVWLWFRMAMLKFRAWIWNEDRHGLDPGIWSVPCKLCLLFLPQIQLLYFSHIDP